MERKVKESVNSSATKKEQSKEVTPGEALEKLISILSRSNNPFN